MTDKPRRFRFSLRSLILLVALAGNGYGLWARWEPWIKVSENEIAVKFNTPHDVRWSNIYFTDNKNLLHIELQASIEYVTLNQAPFLTKEHLYVMEYEYNLKSNTARLLSRRYQTIEHKHRGDVDNFYDHEFFVDQAPLANREAIYIIEKSEVPASGSINYLLVIREIAGGKVLAILDKGFPCIGSYLQMDQVLSRSAISAATRSRSSVAAVPNTGTASRGSRNSG